jgi:DNA polymerase (family 10)
VSTNAALAEIFDEMAALLELTGANVFRVNAHRRVARELRDLSADVADLARDPKQLTAIEGIGEGSARKIVEFVRTGRVKEHDELLAAVPAGLLDVMRVPGLGPKTVKLLWEQAGVTDLATLHAALDGGRLAGLPRMGEKTIAKIKSALSFVEHAAERTPLGLAHRVAAQVLARLRGAAGRGARIECAGSLRRGLDTIGDLDVVVAAKEAAPIAKAFTTMPEVRSVVGAGETECSVRLESGMQADLRIVPPESWGAALLYFTGSKQHNVTLRERAVKRGMRLNEYGLFPAAEGAGDDRPPQERGVKPVAAVTEEEIYAALDLPWIPPELREDRGEFDQPPPKLLERREIRAELHAHTVASDGHWTIAELAREAKRRGFHTVAVTDHSKSSAQAGGLSEDALRAHIEAVRRANDEIDGIEILAGSEVDILGDGRLDYGDDLLAQLDIVVAAPHVALSQEPKVATERLLKAIRHPLVHVIAHPTGRIVGRRAGLAPDMAQIVAAAAEHRTALEVNANWHRLDLRDAHVRSAVDAGALIAINTDAHSAEDMDHLPFGVTTARRGWLTATRCVNTWSAKKIRAWLKEKRE